MRTDVADRHPGTRRELIDGQVDVGSSHAADATGRMYRQIM
jgi:hypothetical protein